MEDKIKKNKNAQKLELLKKEIKKKIESIEKADDNGTKKDTENDSEIIVKEIEDLQIKLKSKDLENISKLKITIN